MVDDVAWVLIEERHERGLGVGLAWMQRSGAGGLRLLTADDAGLLARRAELFEGDVQVLRIDDRHLVLAEPEQVAPEPSPDRRHLDLVSTIEVSGADVVIEHGVVAGEVFGLEVCRVVDDPTSGEPRVDIGVGVHDREAFDLLHGGTPRSDSLKRIVDVVTGHRRPGADPHPLNRLAPERALRHAAMADPDIVEARRLRPVSSVVPRRNVKDSVPCAAVGESTTGEPIVAVFSAGIDLDVVPVAGDIRSWLGIADARLVVVVPERDVSPVTRRMAESLRRPAHVVGIADGRENAITL